MTKVEIEKPVVSEKLANEFNRICKATKALSTSLLNVVNPINYAPVPENKYMENNEFVELLMDMCSLGYEIEAEPKYVIKLPITDVDGAEKYLAKSYISIWMLTAAKDEGYKFTMEEIENDTQLLQLKQFAVEVEE